MIVHCHHWLQGMIDTLFLPHAEMTAHMGYAVYTINPQLRSVFSERAQSPLAASTEDARMGENGPMQVSTLSPDRLEKYYVIV